MSATQPTVQDLSQYALLAQAAYAYFNEKNITKDDDVKAALMDSKTSQFTQEQADRFFDGKIKIIIKS